MRVIRGISVVGYVREVIRRVDLGTEREEERGSTKFIRAFMVTRGIWVRRDYSC